MDIHQKAAVWSSAQLLDAGQSSQTVLRALDTAALQRVRRGRYAALPYPDDPVGEHRRRTIDLAQEVGRAAVVSHGSAAVLWGVEIPPELDLSSVHFTWPGAAGRGTSTNIHPHRARLDPEDVLESRTAVGVGGSLEDRGILVTTPARTVYDLARSADQRVAVSVADDHAAFQLPNRSSDRYWRG